MKKILGTGGAISQFKNKTTKNFFVINGDTFFDINLNEIFDKYKNRKEIYIPLSNSNNYKSNNKLTNLSINKKNQINFNSNSKYFNGEFIFK